MNLLRLYSIIIVVSMLSLTSCNNNTSEAPEAIKLEGLTLNNNKKWLANEETHIGMKRIDSILKHNRISDGKLLEEALSKQTSYIIRSCDMEGEAHDQLHVVLVPILEKIADLKETENTSELKKEITTLQGLTNTYFKHFKI